MRFELEQMRQRWEEATRTVQPVEYGVGMDFHPDLGVGLKIPKTRYDTEGLYALVAQATNAGLGDHFPRVEKILGDDPQRSGLFVQDLRRTFGRAKFTYADFQCYRWGSDPFGTDVPWQIRQANLQLKRNGLQLDSLFEEGITRLHDYLMTMGVGLPTDAVTIGYIQESSGAVTRKLIVSELNLVHLQVPRPGLELGNVYDMVEASYGVG